jgi:hypothetical protein
MANTKLTIKIHNVETGEIIERDMTAQEIAKVEAKAQVDAEIKAEAEAKAIAKAQILDRLGLTADELKTILG